MFFLYSAATSRTGRVLRRALQIRGGYPSRRARYPEERLLIRWGSSSGSDAEITINAGEAVARAADKLESLKVLQNAGILVPPFSTNPDDLDGDRPFLGRRRHHYGGTDIVIYMRDEEHDYGEHAYFTQYIESERELRLHIVNGEMIRAQIKQFEGEHEGHLPIRNHANGYRFIPFTHRRPNEGRLTAATESVAALGLDFGAVDILCGTDGGSYVLEVNTAPGCIGPTAERYVESLASLARERGISITPNYDILRSDDDQ